MRLIAAQLDAIKRAAKKAAPRHRRINSEGGHIPGPGVALKGAGAGGVCVAEAIYIDKMDPASMLELLAEVRELRSIIRRAVFEVSDEYARSTLNDPTTEAMESHKRWCAELITLLEGRAS